MYLLYSLLPLCSNTGRRFLRKKKRKFWYIDHSSRDGHTKVSAFSRSINQFFRFSLDNSISTICAFLYGYGIGGLSNQSFRFLLPEFLFRYTIVSVYAYQRFRFFYRKPAIFKGFPFLNKRIEYMLLYIFPYNYSIYLYGMPQDLVLCICFPNWRSYILLWGSLSGMEHKGGRFVETGRMPVHSWLVYRWLHRALRSSRSGQTQYSVQQFSMFSAKKRKIWMVCIICYILCFGARIGQTNFSVF